VYREGEPPRRCWAGSDGKGLRGKGDIKYGGGRIGGKGADRMDWVGEAGKRSGAGREGEGSRGNVDQIGIRAVI